MTHLEHLEQYEEIQYEDIAKMQDDLKGMSVQELFNDCSLYQQDLFPDETKLTYEEERLLHSIAMQSRMSDIIHKYEEYISSDSDKPNAAVIIHDFVLRCIVRNWYMKCSNLRELLALWKPYVLGLKTSHYDNTACAEAIYQMASELIRSPPSIHDPEDVEWLEDKALDLSALVNFENVYLRTRVHIPEPSKILDSYIAQIEALLRRHAMAMAMESTSKASASLHRETSWARA